MLREPSVTDASRTSDPAVAERGPSREYEGSHEPDQLKRADADRLLAVRTLRRFAAVGMVQQDQQIGSKTLAVNPIGIEQASGRATDFD